MWPKCVSANATIMFIPLFSVVVEEVFLLVQGIICYLDKLSKFKSELIVLNVSRTLQTLTLVVI